MKLNNWIKQLLIFFISFVVSFLIFQMIVYETLQ